MDVLLAEMQANAADVLIREEAHIMQNTHIVLGEHAFNRISDRCDKCGRSRTWYEDNGKPRCTEQRSTERREAMEIPDD
jgi:hypothetical protein